MTTSGKDDERDELDDPAIRSMRSVWISMRDEEPPSAGLAELLAAARAKAEEMRPREPWWRRIFVAMRRPPVLAFATVIVLLGGAIVIGARRDTFESMPMVETDRSRDEDVTARLETTEPKAKANDTSAVAPARPAPEPAEEAVVTGAREKKGDALAAAAAEQAREGAAVRESEATAQTPRAGQPTAPPGTAAGAPAVAQPPRRTPPPDSVAPPADRGAGQKQEVVAPAPPPAPPVVARPQTRPQGPSPAAPGVQAPGRQRLQIADDGITPDSPLGNAPAPPASGAPAAPALDAAERVETTDRQRGPSVTQLAKQSETAAARGDCAAVRVIVKRIRELDAAFGKQHVEKNAAVKRCVK